MVAPDWQLSDIMFLNWNMPILTTPVQEWTDWDWICHQIGKGGRTCAIYGAVLQVRSKALIHLSGMALHRARFFWTVNTELRYSSGVAPPWGTAADAGGCGWAHSGGMWSVRPAVQGPWPCCGLGCAVAVVGGRAEKRRMTEGIALGWSPFIFMEALIRLWFFWNGRGISKTFAGQEYVSCPALFQASCRNSFFCLYFSLMSQAPKMYYFIFKVTL